MRRLLLALALGTTTPAPAQHRHHPPAPPAAPAPDPHAGHSMPAPAPEADPHAGHSMPAPAPTADPHAGHVMPAPTADPHAGHAMPAADPADPHAGHAMPSASPAAPPVLPPPAAASGGPAHAADLAWGADAMAASRAALAREHGGIVTSRLRVDRLEARIGRGRDGYAWDADYFVGGAIDRLWIKTEGEGEFGHAVEQAEAQILWGHAIGPYFDLQAGIRADLRPDPERVHLVLGAMGLAPYWIEVDAALFLSDKGDLTARIEAEHDVQLTQRLVLQPRVELDLAAQDVPALGIGAGLTSAEAGLRLRYELTPGIAPYVGLEHERAFGGTRALRRATGEEAGGWNLLVGLRAVF